MSDNADRERLFVYGVLRRGIDCPVRAFFDGATRLVASASVQGRLRALGPYRCAAPSSNPADRIDGELCDILMEPAEFFRVIDEYEGCVRTPPLYRRGRAEAMLEDGSLTPTWIYWCAAAADGCSGA